MKTLNDEFDEYRDCLRVVWNYALRRRSPKDGAFDELSNALLKMLVLDFLGSESSVERNDLGYVAGLGISIASENAEVMFPDETDDAIVWNRVATPLARGTVLFYADVMDFRDDDGMRDLDFVKGIAQGSGPTAGQTFAVRRSDVDVVDLTS